MNPLELNDLIRKRRTVKPANLKQGSVVPDEVIEQALINATWAPNHGKTQPWYFIVFSGNGLKDLCHFQSELYKKDAGEKFSNAKFNNLACQHEQISHSIAICYKRNSLTRIPEIEEIEAIGCAVQNLALTITANGYGGMWSTGGITYNENARSYFNLEGSDRLLGFYLVGEIRELPPEVPRIPISEKAKWVK